VDGYGPAMESEQVAALTEDEDGSVQWILAVVHKYYAEEVRSSIGWRLLPFPVSSIDKRI